MGYSKMRSKVIKNNSHLRIRAKDLEIMTPKIILTKPVEKLEIKNNEKEKGEV